MLSTPSTAVAIPGASGAVTITSGVRRVVGWSLGETAGAVAKVRLRNTDVSGQILCVVNLAASASSNHVAPAGGVSVPGEALYVELVSGAVEGSIYLA